MISQEILEKAAKALHEAERTAYVAAGETTHLPWDACEWPDDDSEGWTLEQWLGFVQAALTAAYPELLERAQKAETTWIEERRLRREVTEGQRDAALARAESAEARLKEAERERDEHSKLRREAIETAQAQRERIDRLIYERDEAKRCESSAESRLAEARLKEVERKLSAIVEDRRQAVRWMEREREDARTRLADATEQISWTLSRCNAAMGDGFSGTPSSAVAAVCDGLIRARAELADAMEALRNAEEFLETVTQWTGSDPDELQELREILFSTLTRLEREG